MANYHYSADSARSPLPSLQPSLLLTGKNGSHKIAVSASINEKPPATATFLIEAKYNFGEGCDLERRVRDYDDVHAPHDNPASPAPSH